MRSAEIMLAWARGVLPTKHRGTFDDEGFCNMMIQARKLWSIFQHHDGMTGTAARHVVQVLFFIISLLYCFLSLICRTGLWCHVTYCFVEC